MQDNESRQRLSRISTQWTLLRQAHQGQGDAVAEAQRALMQRYCGAVYCYLRAALRDPDAADDLSQDFALRFVRGDFKRADPQRGRFRDFVKKALYHLIVDYRQRRQRQPQPLPADSAELPPGAADPGQADVEFIQHWRDELLERAWEALAESESQTGQLYYTVLRWRAEHPQTPAAQLAAQLSAEKGKPFTEAGVRQTLHRSREKFADLLVAEVGRSLETTAPDRVEQELIDLGLLRYCQPALARRPPGG
jgi:RNA polymerase sigma-70 factor (ECF subfamily)